MSFKVTRLGPPQIRRDTITVGGIVFTSDDLGGAALSDDTPLIEAGAGDAGVSTEASRSDHVHPEFGSSTIWRPLMAFDPDDDHWYVVVAEDGTAVMVEG